MNNQKWLKLTLVILFIGIIFFYLFIFVYSIRDGQYFPFHEDESIYYNAGRIFSEANSLKLPSCNNEDVSRILATTWYGPLYNLLYGIPAKIFGFNNTYFIMMNILFFLLSIVFILVSTNPVIDKLIYAISYSLSYFAFSYSATYFPELFHLFLATVLTITLIKLYCYWPENSRKFRNTKILFVSLVLIATLFRVTSIFWLVGILAFSNSRKQLTINVVIAVVGLFLSLLYLYYFTANPWTPQSRAISKFFALDLVGFCLDISHNIIGNISRFFYFSSGEPAILLLLFLIVIYLSLLVFRRNRLILAVCMIVWMYVVTLISTYTTSSFFILKQTNYLFPLLLLCTPFLYIDKFKYIVLAFIFVSFPATLSKTYNNILDRRISFSKYSHEYKGFVDALERIRTLVSPDKENVILWSFNENTDYGRATESILPVTNSKNIPIIYTSNWVNPDVPDADKFKRFNRLNIDYIFSRKAISFENYELLERNNYFSFYKRTN